MKKRNWLIVCLIALVALMLFPSCKQETPKPDAKAWVAEVQKVVSEATKKSGEGMLTYMQANLPKKPILSKNPEFTAEANKIMQVEFVKAKVAEIEQKIKDDPEHKAIYEQQIEETKTLAKDYTFFKINGDNTYVEPIGLYQDSEGNWLSIT